MLEYRSAAFAIFLSVAVLSTAVAQGKSVRQMPSSAPGVLSSSLYPCTNCHAGMEPNPKQRMLTFHGEIKIQGHGEPRRWCLGCHDLSDRNRLRLSDGGIVSFEESHLLCGQCHGIVYKAWKAGIHGKRTGQWDGTKRYLLCTSCHNPHSPRFKNLKPERAPLRPEMTLRK